MPTHEEFEFPDIGIQEVVYTMTKCVHEHHDKLNEKTICRYDGSIRNQCPLRCPHYKKKLLDQFLDWLAEKL